MLRRIKWDQQREEADADPDKVRNIVVSLAVSSDTYLHGLMHMYIPMTAIIPFLQDDDEEEDEEEHEAGASSGANKTCELVWKGVVAKPAFTGFKFQVGTDFVCSWFV